MKPRGTPLFDRSGRDVLRTARSWADVLDGFRHVRLGDDELIHVIVVGSATSVAEALVERASIGLRRLPSSGELDAFAYTKKFGKRDQHRVSGEFVVAKWKEAPVYLVVCCSAPAFVREALGPLLERTYSKVVRPYLAQHELHELLRAVQKGVQPDVLRIQEFSAKRRLQSARRRFESVRDWTDVDPESAFREARERNVWFSSVRFEVSRRLGSEAGRWVGLHGRLSKYGDVSVDGGFDIVDQIVLPYLTGVTADRLRLFSNRGRASAPHHDVMPLEIAYDQPLLKSTDDLKRLLESLRRFPNGTCTVLHGNPYLHVTLVDDLDFSSADVWVLSQSNILIVPQLRASSGALKRLVNHIFENFAEGKVGEPKTA